MKQLRLTLMTLLVLCALSFPATAQTKLASVDLKKIFTGYWKTKQANVALENRQTELKKEMRDMADGLDKAQTDYKQLLDQANDPALSAEERDKRKQSATAKAKEIATTKSTLEQFQRQAEAQLADESQRMRGNLLTDIQKAVADKAKAGDYTLVVNAANPDAFMYVSASADITAAVLTQLNAGAPIDLTTPASSPILNVSTNHP